MLPLQQVHKLPQTAEVVVAEVETIVKAAVTVEVAVDAAVAVAKAVDAAVDATKMKAHASKSVWLKSIVWQLP